VWESGATALDGAYSGREFFLDGDTVEFSWKARGTNSARFTILVDGLPTTLAPFQPSGTTTAGLTYYMKLVWGTSKRRRITVLSSRIAAWGAFRFGATTTVQATPARPLVTAVGASFDAGFTTGNNTSSLQGMAVIWSRLLGVDVQVAAQETTGFMAAGGTETFGDPARIARGVERTPELVVFVGSGNDLGVGTLSDYTTAVTSALDAWATALPGVPFIVFGIPPRNSSDTTTTEIAERNNALREVAIAHDSVLAFHDMLGIPTDVVPDAYSSSKADYVAGDLVTYQGSVWQLSPHIVGSTPANAVPGTSERWRLVTWAYSGTGKVGATTGNGTRDVLLSNDGTHPEPKGLEVLARYVEDRIRQTLGSV
jgi:hypothetical protein